jgi:hypothetical protein
MPNRTRNGKILLPELGNGPPRQASLQRQAHFVKVLYYHNGKLMHTDAVGLDIFQSFPKLPEV